MIGDWLRIYHDQLVALFKPLLDRFPSYSTIRCTLLSLDYQTYAIQLSRFFGIIPFPRETIVVDGKVLRVFYEAISEAPTIDSHEVTMLEMPIL